MESNLINAYKFTRDAFPHWSASRILATARRDTETGIPNLVFYPSSRLKSAFCEGAGLESFPNV